MREQLIQASGAILYREYRLCNRKLELAPNSSVRTFEAARDITDDFPIRCTFHSTFLSRLMFVALQLSSLLMHTGCAGCIILVGALILGGSIRTNSKFSCCIDASKHMIFSPVLSMSARWSAPHSTRMCTLCLHVCIRYRVVTTRAHASWVFV